MLAEFVVEYSVIFWIVVAIMAGAIEASTAGLISVWFAVGALFAIIPAYLGWSFNGQLAVFIAASIFALLFTRPLVKRVLRVKETPTNADMIIGQSGAVVTEIDNIAGQGRVLVSGLAWAAKSADGSKIKEGARVEVIALSGVTLTVREKKD